MKDTDTTKRLICHEKNIYSVTCVLTAVGFLKPQTRSQNTNDSVSVAGSFFTRMCQSASSLGDHQLHHPPAVIQPDGWLWKAMAWTVLPLCNQLPPPWVSWRRALQVFPYKPCGRCGSVNESGNQFKCQTASGALKTKTIREKTSPPRAFIFLTSRNTMTPASWVTETNGRWINKAIGFAGFATSTKAHTSGEFQSYPERCEGSGNPGGLHVGDTPCYALENEMEQ